jgi:septum formation protein
VALIDLPLPVVLASASPRRHELLRQIVDSFEVVVSNVDEEALTVPDPWLTAEALSLAKASAVAALRPKSLVIGGDTVVSIDDGGSFAQLSKPKDQQEAARMLMLLSGRTHQVITGVSLIVQGVSETFSVTTSVAFRALTEKEARDYVATGEPMDKAGAYAIQGGAAGFVQGLEGSLTNVIGLPIEELSLRLNRIARALTPETR